MGVESASSSELLSRSTVRFLLLTGEELVDGPASDVGNAMLAMKMGRRN